jgi:ribosomal protein S18 acetylase RimI-like enzyme
VGGALMDRAEAFLSQSSPDIFLLTSDFNQSAQRFYQRRGYRQVGALPDYVLPGVTELIFWKRMG